MNRPRYEIDVGDFVNGHEVLDVIPSIHFNAKPKVVVACYTCSEPTVKRIDDIQRVDKVFCGCHCKYKYGATLRRWL